MRAMLGFGLVMTFLCSLSLTSLSDSESSRSNVVISRKRILPSSHFQNPCGAAALLPDGGDLNTISRKLIANKNDVLSTLKFLENATSESLRELFSQQLAHQVMKGNLLLEDEMLVLVSNQQLKRQRLSLREVRRKDLDSKDKIGN